MGREKEKTIHLEEIIIVKNVKKMIPGAAIALVIAAAAKFLESLEESAGLHFIGASVIAMFIGMIVNAFYKPNSVTAPGIKFTSKKILKFAIILLGASLNIRTVLTVGRFSLTVMVFTLATCFGLGALIGKALGLNWKTSSLINAGTGICGGSAIAAIAPVIEATDMDIAYGLSATFLFDTVMIVVFPILGHWMGLSDAAFGLWAGTAVNDTSSVVATGYAFSEAAGDFATMVKLTRTLAIIPAVLAFAAINVHLKRKAQAAEGTAVKVSIKSIFRARAAQSDLLLHREHKVHVVPDILPLQLFRDPAQHRAADAVIKRTPGYAPPTQAGQTAFQRAEIADLHLALRLTFVFGADIHVHLFRFQVSGSRASLRNQHTLGTVSEHNSGVRRRNAVDAANRRNADKSVVVYQRDQKSDLVHMRAKHDAPALPLRGTSLPVGNERAHRIVVHAVTQRRHGHHQLVRNRLFIAGDTPHGGQSFH